MSRINNEASNKQLAQRFFNGIAQADRAGLMRIVSPDLTWAVPQSAVPPYAGTHHGAAHIVDMMLGAVGQTFLPGTVEHRILMMIADGDTVVAETNMRARQESGLEYSNFYVFIFEFQDGLISGIREHVDTTYAINFFSAGH